MFSFVIQSAKKVFSSTSWSTSDRPLRKALRSSQSSNSMSSPQDCSLSSVDRGGASKSESNSNSGREIPEWSSSVRLGETSKSIELGETSLKTIGFEEARDLDEARELEDASSMCNKSCVSSSSSLSSSASSFALLSCPPGSMSLGLTGRASTTTPSCCPPSKAYS